VRVLERDPVDAANPDTFTTTLVDVDTANDEVELDDGFGSGGRPELDEDKRYVLVYDDYVASGDDQLLHAFQADDADGLIQDTIEPNEYADDGLTGYTEVDGTELYERHSEVQWGDGEPFTAHLARQLIVAHNALAHHKTAITLPFATQQLGVVVTTPAVARQALVPIGFGIEPVGYKRLFTIRATMELANAGDTGYVRVTTSKVPPTGETSSAVSFQEPYRQVTFSLTGTTDPTVSDPEELEVIRSRPGTTFITVETWVETAGDAMTVWGFAQFDLGPLVPA
jgi:hypothetical protein